MTTKKKAPVKGMFDMEKRLAELEKKVEVIYKVSLALDKWLTAHAWNKGVLQEDEEEDSEDEKPTQLEHGWVIVCETKAARMFYEGELHRAGKKKTKWTEDVHEALVFRTEMKAEDIAEDLEPVTPCSYPPYVREVVGIPAHGPDMDETLWELTQEKPKKRRT